MGEAHFEHGREQQCHQHAREVGSQVLHEPVGRHVCADEYGPPDDAEVAQQAVVQGFERCQKRNSEYAQEDAAHDCQPALDGRNLVARGGAMTAMPCGTHRQSIRE